MLQADVSIFFVKNKNRSLSLCANYKNLNQITIKGKYPLLLFFEMFDRLLRAKYCKKIYICWVYNLIRIYAHDE